MDGLGTTVASVNVLRGLPWPLRISRRSEGCSRGALPWRWGPPSRCTSQQIVKTQMRRRARRQLQTAQAAWLRNYSIDASSFQTFACVLWGSARPARGEVRRAMLAHSHGREAAKEDWQRGHTSRLGWPSDVDNRVLHRVPAVRIDGQLLNFARDGRREKTDRRDGDSCTIDEGALCDTQEMRMGAKAWNRSRVEGSEPQATRRRQPAWVR